VGAHQPFLSGPLIHNRVPAQTFGYFSPVTFLKT
jgi:hypothetical protein